MLTEQRIVEGRFYACHRLYEYVASRTSVISSTFFFLFVLNQNGHHKHRVSQWRSEPKIFLGEKLWKGQKRFILGEKQYFFRDTASQSTNWLEMLTIWGAWPPGIALTTPMGSFLLLTLACQNSGYSNISWLCKCCLLAVCMWTEKIRVINSVITLKWKDSQSNHHSKTVLGMCIQAC